MNYEIAAELQNAGFVSQATFKEWARFFCPHQLTGDGFSGGHDVSNCQNHIYFPHLSELIEACGNAFEGLERLPNNLWGAYSDTEERPENSIGTSPEEAVAMLWLALNRKS